jgi:hypothetical protein
MLNQLFGPQSRGAWSRRLLVGERGKTSAKITPNKSASTTTIGTNQIGLNPGYLRKIMTNTVE